MQAGGASRVGQEVKVAAEQSPCEADSAEGAMSRLGNYLGSWVGLGSVPENRGGLLCAASGVSVPSSHEFTVCNGLFA